MHKMWVRKMNEKIEIRKKTSEVLKGKRMWRTLVNNYTGTHNY